MREILTRTLTSEDQSKKDCLITEITCINGFQTKIVRRCTYKVTREVALASLNDCMSWASKSIAPKNPRRVFIRKLLDSETGTEIIIYKVLGHLYSVTNTTIYDIRYRHIISMNVGEIN